MKIINQTKTVDKKDQQKLQSKENMENTSHRNRTDALNGEKYKIVGCYLGTYPIYALHVFKSSLQENGIQFSKKSKFIHVKSPEKATLLTYKKIHSFKGSYGLFYEIEQQWALVKSLQKKWEKPYTVKVVGIKALES